MLAIENLKLRFYFHPREKYYPCSSEFLTHQERVPLHDFVVYRSIKPYPVAYKGKTYQAIRFTLLYQVNQGIEVAPAIDMGGANELKPTLGKHNGDSECLVVLFEKETGKLKWIYFSAHSSREGQWVSYDKASTESDIVNVFVALGSHANYYVENISRVKKVDQFHIKRFYGVADDLISDKGLIKMVAFEETKPATKEDDERVGKHSGVRTPTERYVPPEKTWSKFDKESGFGIIKNELQKLFN